MLLIKKFLPIIVIILPVVAFTQNCTTLDTLNWMLGEWQQDGEKSVTTETWTQLSAGTYEGLGLTRSKSEDKITFVEALRLIEMTNEVFYLAKVSHNAFPIAFKLIKCSVSMAVFENTTHDFPQKIVYQVTNDGRSLAVTVSNNERQFTVEYKKIEDQ